MEPGLNGAGTWCQKICKWSRHLMPPSPWFLLGRFSFRNLRLLRAVGKLAQWQLTPGRAVPEYLNKLDAKRSMKPDRMFAWILRELTDVIVKPLTDEVWTRWVDSRVDWKFEAAREGTKSSGHQVQDRKFHSNVRKPPFFTARLLKHWNRLLRELRGLHPWGEH